MEHPAIGAHPLGRETRGFAGADVPFPREVGRRPRPPRFGRVVDAKAAFEARVAGVVGPGAVRKLLPPEVTLQGRAVSHLLAQTVPRMREHGAALGDVARPNRRPVFISVREKLVSDALP